MDMTNKKGSSTTQALRTSEHLVCTCGSNVDTVGKPCNKVLWCCGAMPRESCLSSAAPCRLWYLAVLPDVSLAEQPRPPTQTLVKAAQHGSSTTRLLPQAETHLHPLTTGSPPSPAPHPTHLHRNRLPCCFQIRGHTPQWLVVGQASSQSRHAPTLKLPLGGATAPAVTCQQDHRPSAMQRTP
jgi:hypothetical protein